jgi:acetylornithine/succinyldiaminopimelate/putrescine aminotransferase
LTDAYHGHTGLALAAGDERAAAAFLCDEPTAVVRVPFDDLVALAAALAAHEAAAVLVETIPATAGFPMPSPGYLPGVRRLCDTYGAAYIADEVQTGLGRTGSLWATQHFGVVPDILVTGKGLSGGIYPIAATLLSEAMGAWLEEDGWGHISTFGGSELGCQVASRVLEITMDPATVTQAAAVAQRWAAGLTDLAERYPRWIAEVRQTGLVIGLRMHQEVAGMLMTRLLFDDGVWAMFAGFDRSVLQLKPGLLMDDATSDEALAGLGRACATAASW